MTAEELVAGTVADVRDRVATVDDLELLHDARELEQRSTARASIEARIAELEAPAAPDEAAEAEDDAAQAEPAPAEPGEPAAEQVMDAAPPEAVMDPPVIRAGGYRIGPRGGWITERDAST